MSTIVDIHCHNFNGDDLPVRGFIQRVQFDDANLAGDLASAADYLVQKAAPGYEKEKTKLDRLLGYQEFEATFESSRLREGESIEAELAGEVDLAYEELEAANPALLRRIGIGLASEDLPERSDADGGEPGDDFAREGFLDWISAARRGVRWVKLFAKYRLDVTRALVSNFGDSVDLFTPMTVDLGLGLNDKAATTMRQQMELQEKISRLSMRGLIRGGGKAHIHPFIGFDPRRDLRSRMSGDVESALDVVKLAVEKYGFVGVKLYPPMGWRPIDNKATVDMTGSEAGQVDEILREFYKWAEENQVPVTAHCNPSNEAHSTYRFFSHPDLWERVLTEFPALHLNLGHFGGARVEEPRDGWPWKIARLVKNFDHLYADVGNHRTDKHEVLDAYIDMLAEMFAEEETEKMHDRLMYGSDWFMLAILPDHHEFLTRYRDGYSERFGAASTDRFLGGAALDFLGFSDASNSNANRLGQRYQKHAPARFPDWLAGKTPIDAATIDLPGGGL